MSGNECDFNNIETRAVIRFFFLQGKAPKEFHAILTETLGENAPSYATVKNWVAQFKLGDSSDAEVIAAAETWLDGQPSEFFLSVLQKLEQRVKKCIECRGEYVE